jgi:hypothetical protein
MSKAHHDEPLRRHWLYIPLVAFLVFAVGPSVLAPIFFVLSLLVDIPIVGPVKRAPDLISILVYPLLLGLMFWPLLWLYGFARDALIEDPSSEKSLMAYWPRDRVDVVALPPLRRSIDASGMARRASPAGSRQ